MNNDAERLECELCAQDAVFTLGHGLYVEAGACRTHLEDVVDRLYAGPGTDEPFTVIPVRYTA